MVTSYFLNLIAGNIMNIESFGGFPTDYYVALSTDIPAEDGSGFTEVTGGGYVRGVFGDSAVPDDGSVTNLSPINYPEATEDWGIIRAFGLYDMATGGNLLAWDVLEPEQSIVSGNQVRFKAGALKLLFQAGVEE